jgi:hypothetical protein
MASPGLPSRDGIDPKNKECPLCGQVVPGGPEGMNRHFEDDCPWRHTSKPPLVQPPGRAAEPPP